MKTNKPSENGFISSYNEVLGVSCRMEQPFTKPPFWAENGPQFTRYNELDTFLRMSSFAWHAELACRKRLERGAAFPGGLNTPKTTE